MNGQELTIQLPATHDVLLKKDLIRFIKGSNNFKRVLSAVQEGKQYKGSALGRQIIAGALAMEPRISMRGMELVIGASIASLFADVNIGINFENLPFRVPSATTIKDSIIDLASEMIFLLQQTLREVSKVYISCDKGHRSGISHLVKILSWWDTTNNEVQTFLLDLDGSGDSRKECAQAIGHSLKKLEGSVQQLSGQTTDSGGGGTLNSLRDEMVALNITKEDYLVANCTLHSQQILLKGPTEDVFGDGGLGKRNVMQLLHSAYDLQQCFEFQEFKILWKQIEAEIGAENSEKVLKMQEPIATRWWCIGIAASYMKEFWNLFLAICQGIINDSNTDKRVNKIASGLESLMNEEELKSDLLFLAAYHHFFMTPHFKFLQAAGDRSKKPGYQSNNILVRYFLMHEDIEAMKDEGWKQNEKFKDFKDSLITLQEDQQHRCTAKANMFFERVLEKLEFYIQRWANELFMACLGSEKETAQRAAIYLVDENQEQEQTNIHTIRIFHSAIHDRQIELDPFSRFIARFCTTRDTIKQMQAFKLHSNAIYFISNGGDLWLESANQELMSFRTFYCETYLPLASNTQLVENFVKEASLVSETGLSEKMRSVLGILRSAVARPVVREFKDLAKVRELKGNQHAKKGIKGQRQLISSEGQDADIRSIPTGAWRTVAFLKFIQKINKDCETEASEEYKEKIKRIRNCLFQDNLQFKIARQTNRIEKYNKSQLKPKQKNKTQLEEGVDHTPRTLGRIMYSALRKNVHIPALKLELRYQNISFLESANFTQLRGALILDEKNRLGQQATDLLLKSFRPLSEAKFET